MSKIQGEPTSLRNKIATAITAVALVGVLGGIGVVAVKANADAQVQANAAQAMAAAAPAYQGAISLGGDLDELAVKSVQAKAAYDAEQARIAAEQAAAAEAARVQTEQAAAAQAAADLAAQQAAQRQAATNQGSSDSPTGPIKCPAGSQANSGDGPNDTSCFPTICFHIQLPDPGHPECEVAFKP
jgi:hypothetical protein